MREIEQTRDRIEESLGELQERLPTPAAWGRRAAGLLAASGAMTSMLFVVRRRRRKRAAARAQPPPVRAVVQVLPEAWAERFREGLDDGRWKPWAAGAAGLYVALRIAELRRLRRLNRALLATR